MSQRDAQLIRSHVERLIAARIAGRAPDDPTSRWLRDLPQRFVKTLSSWGLVDAVPIGSIADLIEHHRQTKAFRTDRTRKIYETVYRSMGEFFSGPVDTVSPSDAERFLAWLRTSKGLSELTAAHRCGLAKAIFRAAVRSKAIPENPFSHLQLGVKASRDKDHFISRETARKILESCDDPEWRAMFALCRYGGLRCPSEVKAAAWEDIDWSQGTVLVTSPKTKSHGHETRMVPLFPELREVLEPIRSTGKIIKIQRKVNHWVAMRRVIVRAGVEPWPKLFHNLRASRETELVESYPLHVVCAWIGNSRPVALRHYLQVRDDHFRRAIQGGAENCSANVGNDEK